MVVEQDDVSTVLRRAGRPRGEVREAIAIALRALMQERASAPLTGVDGRALIGATWPELMQRACVSWDASRQALDNMTRGREVLTVGRVAVPGWCRPLKVYAPAQGLDPRWARGWDSVEAAMSAMCRLHG